MRFNFSGHKHPVGPIFGRNYPERGNIHINFGCTTYHKLIRKEPLAVLQSVCVL